MGHTPFSYSYSQFKWYKEMTIHTRFKELLKILTGYEYTKEHIHKAFFSTRIQPIK